jgi:hypothetical protein
VLSGEIYVSDIRNLTQMGEDAINYTNLFKSWNVTYR